MSGGSYNYLCYKEYNEISNNTQDISKMRDRLMELGFKDVAKETESFLLMIDSFEVRVNARLERLQGIWKAVEWMDSGDSGIEYVHEEVILYRESK